MNEQPNYYAIIPASVRYDKNLLKGSVLLYGEITALSNQKGYCWASDGYFAELYGVDKRSIQRWLSSLEENGYITRIVQKDGKKIVSRSIKLGDKNVSNLVTKTSYPTDKNVTTPTDKNVRENNTSINTTNNNTHNKAPSKSNPAKEMLNIFNNSMNRTLTNSGIFGQLVMKNVSVTEFQDVMNYIVDNWTEDIISNFSSSTLVNKFDKYSDKASEFGYREGKRPNKKSKGNQDLTKAYGDWDF